MRNIQLKAETQYDVKTSDKYKLEDFTMDGKPVVFEESPVVIDNTKPIVYE